MTDNNFTDDELREHERFLANASNDEGLEIGSIFQTTYKFISIPQRGSPGCPPVTMQSQVSFNVEVETEKSGLFKADIKTSDIGGRVTPISNSSIEGRFSFRSGRPTILVASGTSPDYASLWSFHVRGSQGLLKAQFFDKFTISIGGKVCHTWTIRSSLTTFEMNRVRLGKESTYENAILKT